MRITDLMRLNHLLLLALLIVTSGCATMTALPQKNDEVKRGEEHAQKKDKTVKADEAEYRFTPPKDNKLKGTDPEIIKAFKTALKRFEFVTFDEIDFRFVTKPLKVTPAHPHYLELKRPMGTYESYEIDMKRTGHEMMVEIKYSAVTKELNMKTGKVVSQSVPFAFNPKRELLDKVKRTLYKY